MAEPSSSPAPTAAKELPTAIWAPLVAGALMMVPALLGLATGLILLFPSLGPTAVILAYSPEQPFARGYNVLAGHAWGMVSAYAAILAFGLGRSPSVFELGHLTPYHAGAGVAAVTLTVALQIWTRAVHPPAAATTLLIALGAFAPSARDVLVLVAGIGMVAALGEVLRHIRLRQLDGPRPPA